MKRIKVTLEVVVDIPEEMELGVDVNDIPYYLISKDGLELHPSLGFDVANDNKLSNPSDEGCEVVSVYTKIEDFEE
jgi:hypothetical protein